MQFDSRPDTKEKSKNGNLHSNRPERIFIAAHNKKAEKFAEIEKPDVDDNKSESILF